MPALPSAFRHGLSSLKARIVALAVLTGLLSAMGTAAVVLHSAEGSIRRVVLSAAAEDRERSARLLGSKVTVLVDTLSSVAHRVPAEAWSDPDAMSRYLADKPALASLFNSTFAANPAGRMLARVERGAAAAGLPDIGDREYFRRAMASDQPVISEVVLGRVLKAPVVVLAVPVLGAQGRHLGLVGASLALQSTALFEEMRASATTDAVRDLVVDRSGRILAHEDAGRLMQPAADDPGLRELMQEWTSSGSPIDMRAQASLRGDHVVSMAGIPLTDWITVRVTHASDALAPVAEARASALPAALLAGLLAGLAAGVLGYAITRPLTRLRERADALLEAGHDTALWPEGYGEVGQLAAAFRRVVDQRERHQSAVQALLHQMEAVLDHADVGIALTRNGCFELVSRQFCQIFCCDKADVVGQSTRTIYPSDAAFDALVAKARPALSEQGTLDTELQLVRRTGEVFWARLRGRAVMAGKVGSGTIWTIEDVTAVRGQREQLTYTAEHDSLTGLVNRAAFERLLEAAVQDAPSTPFCALFIDLDRFKQVNDTAGHAAGDALLRDVARVLVGAVRRTDTVARLGGDEFAVLLADCPLVQAQEIANKLCAAVQAYALPWGGQRLGVGASVGLVAVDATFTSAAEVMRAADAACYLAKQRGRSRMERYTAMDCLEGARDC